MNLEDIQAWIDDQQRMIASLYATTLTDPRICVWSNQITVHAFGTEEHRWKHKSGSGLTAQEAIEDLLKEFPNPKERINKLREDAIKMLQEAAQMEQEISQ